MKINVFSTIMQKKYLFFSMKGTIEKYLYTRISKCVYINCKITFSCLSPSLYRNEGEVKRKKERDLHHWVLISCLGGVFCLVGSELAVLFLDFLFMSLEGCKYYQVPQTRMMGNLLFLLNMARKLVIKTRWF
jgi:hypothetical protein